MQDQMLCNLRTRRVKPGEPTCAGRPPARLSVLGSRAVISGGAWRRLAVQSGRAARGAVGLGRGQFCPTPSGRCEGAEGKAAG